MIIKKVLLLIFFVSIQCVFGQEQCTQLADAINTTAFQRIACEENYRSSEDVICSAIFCDQRKPDDDCLATPVDRSKPYDAWYLDNASLFFGMDYFLNHAFEVETEESQKTFLLHPLKEKTRTCSCTLTFSAYDDENLDFERHQPGVLKFRVSCRETSRI